MRCPPQSTLAPCLMAFSTLAVTLSSARCSTSGPISASFITAGLPTFTLWNFSSSRAVSFSFTSLCTYKRSALLQICPLLPIRLSKIACAASSKSASGKTMAGALPPNSSDTLVIFGAAASMIFSPAPTLPVRLTMPTFGLLAIALPTNEPLPVTTLNTPAGSPVSCTILQNSVQFSGVS